MSLTFQRISSFVLKRFVLVYGDTFCIKEHPIMHHKAFVFGQLCMT